MIHSFIQTLDYNELFIAFLILMENATILKQYKLDFFQSIN